MELKNDLADNFRTQIGLQNNETLIQDNENLIKNNQNNISLDNIKLSNAQINNVLLSAAQINGPTILNAQCKDTELEGNTSLKNTNIEGNLTINQGNFRIGDNILIGENALSINIPESSSINLTNSDSRITLGNQVLTANDIKFIKDLQTKESENKSSS